LTQWQDANLLDTLACAHAECGQFEDALAWGNKALQSASAEIRDAVQAHVQGFRAGRPARMQRTPSSPSAG
jgi:hypothetical protein